MSKFIFTCPQCRQELEAEEEWIGMQTECPYCKQTINIKKTQTVSTFANIASDEKKCPFCGGLVKKAAVFCKHCKRDLNETLGNKVSAQMESEKTFPYICPDCDTFVELPFSMQGQPYECTGCAESHTATPATERKCPYCGETIKIQASICRFCRKPVPPLSSKTARKCGLVSGNRPASPQNLRSFNNISKGENSWGITEAEIGPIRTLFYTWLICEGVQIFFTIFFYFFRVTSTLWNTNLLLGIAGLVVWFMLYYQYWKQVPVSEAETSPGKAVGFLFIPIFQIYWFIKTTLNLSKHYEQFDDSNKIFSVSQIAIFYFYFILAVFIFSLSKRLFAVYAFDKEGQILLAKVIFGLGLICRSFGIGLWAAMYRCVHKIPRID